MLEWLILQLPFLLVVYREVVFWYCHFRLSCYVGRILGRLPGRLLRLLFRLLGLINDEEWTSLGHEEPDPLSLEGVAVAARRVGSSPFAFACSSHNIPVMRLLLEHRIEHRIDPRQTFRLETGAMVTAAMIAWRDRSQGMMVLLLQHGVSADQLLATGVQWTSVEGSSLSGDWESAADLVRFLQRSGADVNRVAGAFGDTYVHLTSARKNALMLRILLDVGAAPDARDMHGQTPLRRVCGGLVRDSAVPVIAALLEKDADPDARDDSGQAPLHLVCDQHGQGVLPADGVARARAVAMLAEHGADVDAARDEDSFAPIVVAASQDVDDLDDVEEDDAMGQLLHCMAENLPIYDDDVLDE